MARLDDGVSVAENTSADPSAQETTDKTSECLRKLGEPWWDRTTDPLLKRQVLYQLS